MKLQLHAYFSQFKDKETIQVHRIRFLKSFSFSLSRVEKVNGSTVIVHCVLRAAHLTDPISCALFVGRNSSKSKMKH